MCSSDLALRKALMKKAEEGAEETPQSDAEVEEEYALLASEDLWPTFIEVMKGVAGDLKFAHLSQMTTYQRLLFAAKKQMRYPSQDPWETEHFKNMEGRFQDMCKLYDKRTIHKLIDIQFRMLGSIASSLGEYARVLRLTEILIEEGENRRKDYWSKTEQPAAQE